MSRQQCDGCGNVGDTEESGATYHARPERLCKECSQTYCDLCDDAAELTLHSNRPHPDQPELGTWMCDACGKGCTAGCDGGKCSKEFAGIPWKDTPIVKHPSDLEE